VPPRAVITLTALGTLAAGVATAAAAPVWLPPVTLAGAAPGTGPPALAGSPAGRAVAAWATAGPPRAAVRAPGGPWFLAGDVPGAARGATDVDVAAGPDGSAIVSWVAGGRVVVAVRPAGRRFARPVALSAARAVAAAPRCGLAADGEAVCVWLAEPAGGGDPAIQASQRPPDGRWDRPLTLSAAGERAFAPALGVGVGGEAVAVWRRDEGDRHLARGSVRGAGGEWAAPQDLSAAGESVFVEPAVAVGPRGEAVAVWTLGRGGNAVAQGAVRPPSGPWGSPEDLSRPGRDVRGARVALDGSGAAVAVWAREGVVQAAARAPGSGWRPPRDLSQAGWQAGGPRVAANARGDAVATWSAVQGTRFAVQAAVRPADGDFSAPDTLSPDVQSATAPVPAIDARGGVVVAWQIPGGGPDPDLAPNGVRAMSGLVSAPAPDRPVLVDLRPRPARFRPPGATELRFALTGAGPVAIEVRRARDGRPAGAFTVQGRAGLNRVRLAGRVGERRLAPGRYVVTARAPGGPPRSAAVVVLRRR
jgi:hypothetical protein